MRREWIDKVFGVKQAGFEPLALDVFRLQYAENSVYAGFVDAMHVDPVLVDRIEKIPFLPVSVFKGHEVKTGDFSPEAVFESSGTTQSVNSRHPIKDLSLYDCSYMSWFKACYGSPAEWCILGLLPSYLERNNSSLVYMVDGLIRQSKHPSSGFYLYEHQKLADTLQQLEAARVKTLLIGVTFALLDFAEAFPVPLQHTIVMETGGMKGRKQELTREQVHSLLKKAFSLKEVHSEYGMTELLSQAYAKKDGMFNGPPWFKPLVRDEEDPLHVTTKGTGLLNIIDLANIHSCSFIATDDIGKIVEDGTFEVLGRMDGSDLRGCSLLTVHQ